MNFCGQCGQKLMMTRVDREVLRRQVCVACGSIHYENPKVLVWCFAHWQNRLLLCRRAHPPAQGLWNPPAGFVEMGESLEEAAAREMKEETGVVVCPSEMILYRVASVPHMSQVYVGFRVQLRDEPPLIPGPEALEVRLWSKDEFPVQEFAFREMLPEVPDDFYDYLRRGEFPVAAVTVQSKQQLGDHGR